MVRPKARKGTVHVWFGSQYCTDTLRYVCQVLLNFTVKSSTNVFVPFEPTVQQWPDG